MTINDNTIEILKALADTTRFKILELLSTSGNNLCVTAISNKLEISQPVVSQHLKILKNARIVSADRQGYHIHYSINHDTLSGLMEQISKLLEINAHKCTKDTCIIKT